MCLKKYGDFILGLFFVVLSAALFLGAVRIPSTGMEGVGSDFMPKILAVTMGGLSLIQLCIGFKNIKKDYKLDEKNQPEYKRVIATIVSFGVYVFALKPIGFIITSVIYLFIQIMILAPEEKRNIPLFGIISIFFTIVVYGIFRFGLNVTLPDGIIGW